MNPEIDVEVENEEVPFVMVPNGLVDANPSPQALAAYLHLRRRANWSSGRVDYSLAVLAKELGYAKRDSAKPYVDELVELGFLTVEERHGEGGARLRNRYVVRLTPTRSSGQPLPAPAGRPSPAQRVASTDPLVADPLVHSEPSGLFEVESRPKSTKPRGEVDPNVEKLAAGIVELLAENRIVARVDATSRRICGRILSQPGATVEEALGVARFATSDPFWRAHVVTFAALAKHYPKLRLRMPTTGPAAAPIAAPAVGAPLLGDGDHEAAQRARAFLARGFSPARYWDAEQRGEHVALVRRILASPILFDDVDVEGLVIAWNFRAEGRKLSDAVDAWPDYS